MLWYCVAIVAYFIYCNELLKQNRKERRRVDESAQKNLREK
jgi:hypothetical protein